MKQAPITTLFLFLLISLVTGCMGGGPAPQDHYYRLALNSNASNNTGNFAYSEIGIPPSVADGLYRERPVLYVNKDAPLELKQYHYHHWHDSPGRIVQEHLIAWLQHRTPKTAITRLSQGEQSDVMLQTRIVRYERIQTNDVPQVLVALEVLLHKKHKTLHKKMYQQVLKLEGESMHDTVQAFSDALVKIYTDLLSDLKP